MEDQWIFDNIWLITLIKLTLINKGDLLDEVLPATGQLNYSKLKIITAKPVCDDG